MIQSRNASSYTYDEQTAERLVTVIIRDYFPLFEALQTEMTIKQAEIEPMSWRIAKGNHTHVTTAPLKHLI